VTTHRLHELEDGVSADLGVASGGGGQGRALHHGDVVAGELVERQQLAHCDDDVTSECNG